MTVETLEELFKKELFDMYNGEQQITEALPKMRDKATDRELSDAFSQHLDQTERQIERLERVCEMLDYDVQRERCEAMEGIIEEGEKLMKSCEEGPICDSAMIMAAQKVEHYEIASYGSLCALAKVLGHDDAEKILHETLEEERETDEKLTRIAESHVNRDARQEAA